MKELLGRLPRPHRDDALIAATGLLGGLVLWALGLVSNPWLPDLGVGLPDPGALPLAPLLVMCGAELLRRSAPRVALPVGTVALAADQLTGSLIASVAMYADLVYASVLYGSPAAARRVPRNSLIVTVLATIVPLAVLRAPEALLFGFATAVVGPGSAWSGLAVRNHRDAAAAARLRAEQTTLLAELDRRAAIGQERARMARELHDLVANHLSAIAIHSSAALSVTGDDPRATRRALSVIRESSVQGLAEMRRLIELLRTAGEEEPAPAPRLEALDSVLERAGSAGAAGGLAFELRDERPGGAALPAPVELAAYRIVQESLTNALKHAAPGTVTVRLTESAGTLSVIVDSPYLAEPGPRAPGAGAGLVGMAERTALLGGAFEAGPLPEGPGPGTGTGSGLWRVRADLPVTRDEGTTQP
ncbi:histidine kinase [Streptomyces capparidis]